MKLTTMKFITLVWLVLCNAVTNYANAQSEDECQKQDLNTQGLSVAGNTITPGQNVIISMVSDKGKVEATIDLKLKKMKNRVVVYGEIKNMGNCVISTFMPVSLHPIKNGLPLKWHSLPEQFKLSNPTLKPDQLVKFSKEYSIEYAWGFNIKIGSFWLSPSDKLGENNLDTCSDKAIAKQLEKIADQETKSELDACQSAEALNRVNNEILSVIESCKSKMSQQISKEVKSNINATNNKINQACINSDKTNLEKTNNSENTKLKNNQAGTKSMNTHECSDEVLAKRLQAFVDAEIPATSGICDSARGMKRAYEKGLELYGPCVEGQSDPMLQELYRGIEEANQTITGSCS